MKLKKLTKEQEENFKQIFKDNFTFEGKQLLITTINGKFDKEIICELLDLVEEVFPKNKIEKDNRIICEECKKEIKNGYDLKIINVSNKKDAYFHNACFNEKLKKIEWEFKPTNSKD